MVPVVFLWWYSCGTDLWYSCGNERVVLSCGNVPKYRRTCPVVISCGTSCGTSCGNYHRVPQEFFVRAVWLLVRCDGSYSRSGGFRVGRVRCLHFDMSSDLLFYSASLLRTITYFSSRQRLHKPLFLGPRFDFLSTSQVRV